MVKKGIFTAPIRLEVVLENEGSTIAVKKDSKVEKMKIKNGELNVTFAETSARNTPTDLSTLQNGENSDKVENTNMGILDSLRQTKHASEKGRDNVTPPPKGESLAEILKDQKKSDLFGEMLGKSGHEEIALKIVEKRLEEEDLAFLESARQAFLEKMARAEELEKWVNKENVLALAKNHPGFQIVVNLVGLERAVKVIQGQFKKLAIEDEEAFENLAIGIETYEGFKGGKYKARNEETEKMLKERNIKVPEYEEAMKIKDEKKRKKALRVLARKSFGKFRKAVDLITFYRSSKKMAGNLEETGELNKATVAELDNYQDDILATLYSSMNNQSVRDTIASELMGEKTGESGQEQKVGFMDAKKVGPESFDEAKYLSDWEAEKAKTNFGSSDPAQQAAIRDRFQVQQKQAHQEQNKKKGFWRSFFAGLWEKTIDDKKNILK